MAKWLNALSAQRKFTDLYLNLSNQPVENIFVVNLVKQNGETQYLHRKNQLIGKMELMCTEKSWREMETIQDVFCVT